MSTQTSGPVIAIWNPESGSAPKEAALQKALGDSVRLVPTTAEDPGPGQAEDAVAESAATLIACGGDGTVRACLEPLTNSETVLGIVGLGTGNLLAGNLGLETGLKGAEGLRELPVKRIDVGRVNNESFAVMAGSGFDALMIERANPKAKSLFGTAAYVVSGLKSFREERVRTVITVDGERWFDGRTSMVLVGNFGAITGGIEVFPDGSPTDGRLDVLAVRSRTAREWLRFGYRTMRGKTDPDLAQRTQGEIVVVEHAEPRIYELDGEDREPARRLQFDIIPAAVLVHYKEGNP